LRRANEVGPEEPPLVARQRRSAVPPPPPPPPPPPQARPEDEEEPLFPDTYVAPEDAWPTFTSEEHGGGIAQIHAAAAVPGLTEATHDPHVGVREFSVMVRRLGKQVRTRNLVKVVVLSSAAVVLVAGLVLYLLLARPEGEVHPMAESSAATPGTRFETPVKGPKAPRELPKASILENVDGPARTTGPRPRTAIDESGTITSTGSAEAPYTPPAPPPPAAPQLAQIDPSLRQDAQRYGSLLGTDALKREEAPTEIKPRTLTMMPKSTLSPQVMNEFLEKKQKKFVECKAGMKNPPEVPVKVGLSFDVGADGRVGNVQVVPKDGIRDGSLATCLRNVVLEWAFPAQDEATTYRTVLSL